MCFGRNSKRREKPRKRKALGNGKTGKRKGAEPTEPH
jgi:hypothetical protein